MEAVKNALAVLGAIIGALTALLTLYAKFLDVRKSAAKESDAADAAPKAVTPPPEAKPRAVELAEPIGFAPREEYRVYRDPSPVERARRAVKAPAITLMAAGLICLFSNLTVAVFGYVDQFVTPLTTESQDRQAFEARNQQAFLVNARVDGLNYAPTDRVSADRSSAMIGFLALTLLSIPSAVAAWGGFEMLRLRSYWVSVVGSVAIMPAGLVCCMGGVPIGIWSLMVLYQPDVRSSFD